MKRMIRKPQAVFYLAFLLSWGISASLEAEQKSYNAFVPDAFPAEVSDRVFGIPLDADQLRIIYPAGLRDGVSGIRLKWTGHTGTDVPFLDAGQIKTEDLRGRHLILIGNMLNNPWILEMYKQRSAFADAEFPGPKGVIIHPAKSIWDRSRNVLVVGASRNEDLVPAFEALLDRIERGARNLSVIRHIRTAHAVAPPPENVEALFESARKGMAERPLFMGIAKWGLMYHFTGERKWAEYFRDGFRVCHERARKTGLWIPEKWTMMYFTLWNIIHSWTLIDDDPFFTADDRRVIEEVLWGFSRYAAGRPYLDEDKMPLLEPRQNHSTFLALTLHGAYRYFTEKYGIRGLEEMEEKARRCFDLGQKWSYRPNDDAGGGYQVLAPSHYLSYAMQQGDESFLRSGRLARLVDLMVATTSNRREPVEFGDTGSYSPYRPGSPQRAETRFYSMAAWYYRDGAYQWLKNWYSGDSVVSVDAWSPLIQGLYASDIPESEPTRFLGILPVALDEASLRWAALRSEKPTQAPLAGRDYFDKISFRRNFDAQDEYLLLDGTSTFAHGHLDGNSVTGLTWKDRIWLCDLHYIKDEPREHNGVIVVRDGAQEPPPQINELEGAADFDAFGITRTTSRDYGGADWERNIVWKKGAYFLFLDRVTARLGGQYRLENRWRTRGDVDLAGNTLSVKQGDKEFFIKSADSAARALSVQPDEPRGHWDYPYGNGVTAVSLAREELSMAPGSAWTFANLMYAADAGPKSASDYDIEKAGDELYAVSGPGGVETIGLKADGLAKLGVMSDCGLFVRSGGRLGLFNLTQFAWGKIAVQSPGPVSLEIDFRAASATLLVPPGAAGNFVLRDLAVSGPPGPGKEGRPSADSSVINLKPGKYRLVFKDKAPLQPDWGMLSPAPAGKVPPRPAEAAAVDFGFQTLGTAEAAEPISAWASHGGKILYGTVSGKVYETDGARAALLFELPDQKPVRALLAADIDRDGKPEIISAGSSEDLFCHGEEGGLRWNLKLEKYYGADANVTDLAAEDLDGKGFLTVLAATNGWKLYAVNPGGSVRWESFVFYHPLTKVKLLREPGRKLIAVGTVYQSPLNVVDPATGEVVWFTWEQTGSEAMSTTDYCGKNLRDVVFLDTDGDGAKEVVFGTASNQVIALDAADGRTKWMTRVGDAVTALKVIGTPAGREEILASTEAGELYALDRAGRVLRWTSFGSGITAMEPDAAGPEGGQIFLGLADGRLVMCHASFLPKAMMKTGGEPVRGIRISREEGDRRIIRAVTDRRVLRLSCPVYALRPSRHY